ncbi:MAG: hypothetical protein JWM80_1290 [Cyanobacteria bacterium RYN_339]|nr:hypothetical protein [Cyanobacteria bacterium RYN_339]
MKLRLITLALALAVLPATEALASSLPRADFGDRPILGVGLGGNRTWSAGGSLALDMPVYPGLALGGALNTTLAGGLNYDLRGTYRFVDGSQLTPAVAAIAGVWGAPGLAGFSSPLGVAPYLGFALAYPINDRINLRLDLTYAALYDYAKGGETLLFLGGPPSSGLEVGYKFLPNVEATLGINGRGDFVGANLSF